MPTTTAFAIDDRRLEAEETLDLMPDRDGQKDTRDQKDDQDEPEADPGASGSLAMCRARLPTRSMETNGVADGLVIDNGDVVGPRLTRVLRHRVKCRDVAPMT